MLGARGDIKPTDVLPRRIFQYPFIKYAANHWGDHARLSPESSIQSSISAFLEQPQRLASTIQTRYAEFEFAYDADLEARYAGSLALHAAVCYGLEATVDLLLTTLTVGQINGIDCRGKTALHWAIESKSTSIALKLLQARADPESDVRGEMSMRVICTISTGPDWSVIRGRIGDDLDQQSPELVAKRDLVYISVESEQIEIFRTYLSSANNDTEKKARAKNVLFKASSLDRPRVVELAIQNEELIDEPDVHEKTPLVVAVEKSHANNVQTLLHHGASLNIARGRSTAQSQILKAVADQEVLEHRLRLVGDAFQSLHGSTAQALGPGSYNETVHR